MLCVSAGEDMGETVTCQEVNTARNTDLVTQQLPAIPCSCIAWHCVTEYIGVCAFARASDEFNAAAYSM